MENCASIVFQTAIAMVGKLDCRTAKRPNTRPRMSILIDDVRKMLEMLVFYFATECVMRDEMDDR